MNYIMKKRGTLMLAFPLCLLLAACAEKSAESDAAEYSPQPSSENASNEISHTDSSVEEESTEEASPESEAPNPYTKPGPIWQTIG